MCVSAHTCNHACESMQAHACEWLSKEARGVPSPLELKSQVVYKLPIVGAGNESQLLCKSGTFS